MSWLLYSQCVKHQFLYDGSCQGTVRCFSDESLRLKLGPGLICWMEWEKKVALDKEGRQVETASHPGISHQSAVLGSSVCMPCLVLLGWACASPGLGHYLSWVVIILPWAGPAQVRGASHQPTRKFPSGYNDQSIPMTMCRAFSGNMCAIPPWEITR